MGVYGCVFGSDSKHMCGLKRCTHHIGPSAHLDPSFEVMEPKTRKQKERAWKEHRGSEVELHLRAHARQTIQGNLGLKSRSDCQPMNVKPFRLALTGWDGDEENDHTPSLTARTAAHCVALGTS
eukprot:1160545-Pelagomonas_calceolata.AAC.7